MSTAIPIEVYEILEDKLGRENAHVITAAMENAAAAIALQKKVEIRDELSKELASKSDLLAVKIELKSDMRLYFIILVAVIIITNPRTLDLIAKLLLTGPRYTTTTTSYSTKNKSVRFFSKRSFDKTEQFTDNIHRF